MLSVPCIVHLTVLFAHLHLFNLSSNCVRLSDRSKCRHVSRSNLWWWSSLELSTLTLCPSATVHARYSWVLDATLLIKRITCYQESVICFTALLTHLHLYLCSRTLIARGRWCRLDNMFLLENMKVRSSASSSCGLLTDHKIEAYRPLLHKMALHEIYFVYARRHPVFLSSITI